MNLFDNHQPKEDYEESFQRYGAGPKALLWWDYRSMGIRFRELVKDVEIEDKHILDAGCGMGDLLPYLYSKALNFNYLGVDKSPDFIEIAKKRYEGHQFKLGDPFNKQIGTFDVVLSSGVMNGNVPGWLEKRKAMITNLFDQTSGVLAFNMAGGLLPLENDSLIAYANARVIQNFCKTLTKKVILNTSYLARDFTIVMSKR